MKITYFLVNKSSEAGSDKPVLEMKRISLVDFGKDFHPDKIKDRYKSMFIDIQLEDMTEPRENNELLFLSEHLNLNMSILEEIVTDQRPRLESYLDFVFILYKAINLNRDEVSQKKEYQFGLKIKDNIVISIHYAEPILMNFLYRFFNRNRDGLINGGVTYFLSTYLDSLTDPTFEVLREWRSIIKKMEKSILEEPQKEFLNVIIELRQSLLDLDYILRANKEVINKINAFPEVFNKKFLPPELDDHIGHCLDETDILMDTLSTLMQIYYSNESSNLERAVGRLTIITAIFLLPSLIAGIFGMNNPGFPQINFYWVVLFMVILMFMTYSYIKLKWRI